MFKGEYNFNLDDKGRVIIPAKMREALGREFVMVKGFEHCLSLYAAADWELREKELLRQSADRAEARAFIRIYLAGAADMELDKQGRVVLPNAYREYASLEREITIIGAGSSVEIWSTRKWQEYKEHYAEHFEELAEKMADLGLGI